MSLKADLSHTGAEWNFTCLYEMQVNLPLQTSNFIYYAPTPAMAVAGGFMFPGGPKI